MISGPIVTQSPGARQHQTRHSGHSRDSLLLPNYSSSAQPPHNSHHCPQLKTKLYALQILFQGVNCTIINYQSWKVNELIIKEVFDFSWLWCTDCFGMWRYNEYLLVVRAVNNSDTNYTFQRTHLITQLEYKYPESRNHWDPTLYLGGCQRIITNNQADSTQHFNCIQLPHISRSLYHHDKTVSAFHSYLYSVHNWNP